MDKLLKRLIEVLQEEKHVLGKLIQLSHNKTNLLLEANVDAINNVIVEEYELKSTLDDIEFEREKVIMQLSSFLPKDVRQITIRDIIDIIDAPLNLELKAIRDTVKEQLKEYKGISEINLALIQSHLYFVDYMMNTISGRQAQAIIYGSQGYTVSEEKRNYFFDNKA